MSRQRTNGGFSAAMAALVLIASVPQSRGAGDGSPRKPAEPPRFVSSQFSGRSFEVSKPPVAEELAKDFLGALEPAMTQQGYAPDDIRLLAETAARVFLCQLSCSLSEYETLMGTLGGKLSARSAPDHMREAAIKEVEDAWRGADAPNSAERIDLRSLTAVAYDRKRARTLSGARVMPAGRAYIVMFTQYDFGIDLHKAASAPCDLVCIRMPVRDLNGLVSEADLIYLRHPKSKIWIPYQFGLLHEVMTPYPKINF